MKTYRDLLHPIVGIIFGFNWISMFGGFNFPIGQQIFVVSVFNFMVTALCGAFYELFEEKYAEAKPSQSDIVWSGLGGSIGGILWICLGDSTIMQYLLFACVIGVIYDMYKMVKK